MNESTLYEPVSAWLGEYLSGKFKRAKIIVSPTPFKRLHDFLVENNLDMHFPQSAAFDIKVDIVGVILRHEKADMAFIECKINPLSLKDVGQLLGYSKVAYPIFSLLLSPKGFSPYLQMLLQVYGRHDVLNYDHNKTILMAKWDIVKQDLDYTSIIPSGGMSGI